MVMGLSPMLSCHAVRLIDKHTLEVDVDKHTGISNLFAELCELGIDVQSMRNKTNRLEQLFVKMIDEGSFA